MTPLPTLCAEASERAGEPLAGTAATDETWVFVEERGAWAEKPLQSEGLAPIRPALEAWLAALGDARLQLIRHPRQSETEPRPTRRVFLARPAEGRAVSLELADDAFAGFDPARALAEAPPLETPTYFVCTHGKRDRCCAVRGMALYRALAAGGEDDLWQTSHLGGHRFAATMTTLPHGYCLGRVDAAEAPAIRAASGLHALEKVRGRTGWPAAIQAAEVAIRRRLGTTDPAATRLLDAEEGPAGTTVRFRGPAGATHAATVARMERTTTRPKSCGREPEPVAGWETVE